MNTCKDCVWLRKMGDTPVCGVEWKYRNDTQITLVVQDPMDRACNDFSNDKNDDLQDFISFFGL